VLEYSHVHVARDDLTTARPGERGDRLEPRLRARLTVLGEHRQTDGPALQTLALVTMYGQLDVYDGDTDALAGDHPWPATTANFAELYYRLAAQILSSRTVPADSLAAPFLAQAGITTPAASPQDAAAALRAAGDSMLQAIVFHSDHFELSEQFDATTGFEKSVSNLSWSYAAFLSAVRARSLIG
jgi:GH15 family glucan-1,4-alpha-glucosidase